MFRNNKFGNFLCLSILSLSISSSACDDNDHLTNKSIVEYLSIYLSDIFDIDLTIIDFGPLDFDLRPLFARPANNEVELDDEEQKASLESINTGELFPDNQ